MADLDDFFAKKDRKKSKSKKLTPSEDLARKIEDTSKPSQSAKKRDYLPGQHDDEEEAHVSTVNEGEWKDYQDEEERKDYQEEEKRKDYSGLKLGMLHVSDGDAEGAKYSSHRKNENKSRSGPWKEDKVERPVVKQPVQEQAATSSVYVSPALRNAQMAKETKTKNAYPDINNVEFFPVLGSAKPEEVKNKRPEPGFEEVKHGGRLQRSTDLPTNAPVSIGNRFGSLADS